MNHDAIWITGVGVLSPLGHRFDDLADALLAGKSGVERVNRFDVSQHPSQIGAAVRAVPCPDDVDPEQFARRDRYSQAILWCVASALQDAGYWHQRQERRIGIVFGLASEWMWQWEEDHFQHHKLTVENASLEGPSRIARLAEELELSGPCTTVSAACASGNFALAQARRWLQMGWVDVCIAGACDMALTPMVLAAFGNLRALSRQNDRPQAASRPFDKARDGFVLGEGGSVLILERAETARRRAARVYGELAGVGLSSDAYHPVIPSPDAAPATEAIRRALREANVTPEQVDYVNAHGTSTPVGDVCETKALHAAFGSAIENTPVSSTKSMTGHLLTAASALEGIACLASFARRAVPPTINLDDPDPECRLNHVAKVAQERPVKVALSNSFGFGGSNSCAVFKAVS